MHKSLWQCSYDSVQFIIRTTTHTILSCGKHGSPLSTGCFPRWCFLVRSGVTSFRLNSHAKQRLGSFEDSDFVGVLEDSKSTSSGILCIFGSRIFVPMRSMCKKRTSMSHKSTDSGSFFFFGCCFANGRNLWLAIMWDEVIDILHSSKKTHQALREHSRQQKFDDQVPRGRVRGDIQSTNPTTKSKRNSNREVDELSRVDHVVRIAKPFQFEA